MKQNLPVLFCDVLGPQSRLVIFLPEIPFPSIGLESPLPQLGLELTLVLNNHQDTNLEIGLQRREVNPSQSSKGTNGRFHALSGNQRDVISKKNVL